MKFKKTNQIIGVFIVALLLATLGCAYTTKRTNFNPIESNGWKPLYNSKVGQSKLHFKCGAFQIEAHYIPILNVTYSVGPILPIIPIYDKGKDNLKKMLEIELILDGSFPNNILSEKSIVLNLNKSSINVKPTSFKKLNYGKPQEREYYSFIFAITQETVSEFRVIFPQAVGDCLVPPLKYEYRDLGVGYDVLSN